MSDYKRLVSYIYSYPGNVKDKSTGFARAQVRNGQFKLELTLNNVHTDAPEIFSVYLMVRNGHKFNTIKLDNVIINSGCGTYKDLLNPANIKATGYTFSDICGIAIANTDNDYYRMYTLWDDNPFNPSDVLYTDLSPDISDSTDNNPASSNDISDNTDTTVISKNNIFDNTDNTVKTATDSYENAANKNILAPPSAAGNSSPTSQTDTGNNSLIPPTDTSKTSLASQTDTGDNHTASQTCTSNNHTASQTGTSNNHTTSQTGTSNNHTASHDKINEHSKPAQPEIYVTAADSTFTGNSFSAKHNSDIEDVHTPTDTYVDNSKDKNNTPMPLHASYDINNPGIDKKIINDKYHNNAIEKLFKNADYIDAFDNDYYYDCIEISPEQLKALPADDINLTGNSFLIHGYYNFRHLLFGRVRENDNGTHYFIGIPGMYCNRERFMASMYGFGNFKKSHRSDYTNPYFGYWYQEI